MIYTVVMAGGTGTRFWPKSTNVLPKQFLKLFGDKTMIQSTIDRLSGFINIDNCMVVTNNNYVNIVKKQLPEIPADMIIGEKIAKNTAPCVAAAAAILNRKDPDSVMVVLPADHHITEPVRFKQVVKRAVLAAQNDESLVTIGIKPEQPETGYGYIHFDEKEKINIEESDVYKVINFTEKPDLDTAKRFIQTGNYLWNSGMFVWKTSAILKAFKKHMPQIYELSEQIMDSDDLQGEIDLFYEACPSVSIDYGVMEKADNVLVVPGEFGWNDVGSWKAVYELSEKDGNSNSIEAENCFVKDSFGNLVQSDNGKIIAAIGVENLAIVETEKAILICNLDHAQDVKTVFEYLKSKEGLDKFL
ncbi:MAG: mannose-1-phosphate guanylyltransferase [Balneolaceae bacterium]